MSNLIEIMLVWGVLFPIILIVWVAFIVAVYVVYDIVVYNKGETKNENTPVRHR